MLTFNVLNLINDAATEMVDVVSETLKLREKLICYFGEELHPGHMDGLFGQVAFDW